MRLLFIILIALQILLEGCGLSYNFSSEEDLSSLTKAQLLLNQGMFDDAIVLLQQSLEKNPNNQEIKFYLASAYAGKGNISIFSLYPALAPHLFNKKFVDWESNTEFRNPYEHFIDDYWNSSIIPPGIYSLTEIKLIIKQLNKYSWAFYEFTSLMALSPTLTEEQIRYAREALKVIVSNEFFGSRSKDANVFSIIISSVLFFQLSKTFFYRKIQKHPGDVLCQLIPSELFQFIEESLVYLNLIEQALTRIGISTGAIQKYLVLLKEIIGKDLLKSESLRQMLIKIQLNNC